MMLTLTPWLAVDDSRPRPAVPDLPEGGTVSLRKRTLAIVASLSIVLASIALTLTGSNPLNPAHWTKSPNPVFQRSNANGVYAPGHNGFFKSPDGTEDWIVYHSNSSSSGGCYMNRSTRAQKFTWNADGTPDFGPPVALGVTLTAPSGE